MVRLSAPKGRPYQSPLPTNGECWRTPPGRQADVPIIKSFSAPMPYPRRKRIKKVRQRGVKHRDRVGVQFALMIAGMHLANVCVRLVSCLDRAIGGGSELPDPLLREFMPHQRQICLASRTLS